jgi:hypothetical protein
MGDANVVTERQPESPPLYAADKFDANYPAWQKAIESGKLTVTALIAKVGSVGTLTDDQKQQIEALRDAAPIEGEMQ